MDLEKFYIFGGCSFTDMPGSWARYICDEFLHNKNCQLVAKSGAGNSFIATAVMNGALMAEKAGIGYMPDISVMWSHPTRIEYPIDSVQTPYYDNLFDNNKKAKNDFNPGLYALQHLTGEHQRDPRNYWFLSGGNVTEKTVWSNKDSVNKEYQNMWRLHYKYFANINYHWHNTLMCILNVQNLCEAKGWDYRFTVFREYVTEWKNVCAPQFIHLQEAIKWDKFIFTNEKTGGLREYTLNNLNTWDDGYDNHPSHEAHKDFVDNFWLKRFPNVYG